MLYTFTVGKIPITRSSYTYLQQYGVQSIRDNEKKKEGKKKMLFFRVFPNKISTERARERSSSGAQIKGAGGQHRNASSERIVVVVI